MARTWYRPHLRRIHEEADTWQADLLQLEQIASGYADRERFLAELTLDPPDATGDQAGVPLLDEDYLILSTIHTAKGQEWRPFFMLNVVDGCIPSDLGTGTTAELDEERHLLNVGMTRARDSLHLVTPQRFFTHGQNAHGDRHVYAARTRFIPVTLLQFFETTAWPKVSAAASEHSAKEIHIDVGARMRWMGPERRDRGAAASPSRSAGLRRAAWWRLQLRGARIRRPLGRALSHGGAGMPRHHLHQAGFRGLSRRITADP